MLICSIVRTKLDICQTCQLPLLGLLHTSICSMEHLWVDIMESNVRARYFPVYSLDLKPIGICLDTVSNFTTPQ